MCKLTRQRHRILKLCIKDERGFNYCLYIYSVKIEGILSLHLVDEVPRQRNARRMSRASGAVAWEAPESCRLEVYLGPPDIITTDAGKKLSARKFNPIVN